MRVLFVSHHGASGGAERSLLELMEGLGDRGVERLLACPASGPLSEAAIRLGVRVFPLKLCRIRRHPPGGAWGGFLLRWAGVTLRLVRIIVRERVDLVHTNSSLAQVWSWPAIRISRRPFVWHWRDFYDHPKLNRWLAGGRGVSVAVSQSVFDSAKRQLGDSGPVVLVRNGVMAPPTRSGPESVMRWRRERGVGPTDFLAVAMGQAIPRKGFSVLIRALALARASCDSLKVFLACQLPDEDSRSHLQSLRELVREQGCEDRLLLSEEVEEPDLVLRAADVVVVPSLREPFGRVPVEAMLVGKPVICSAVDGLKEIVPDGSTGVLVPAGDERALADALVSIASDPERRARIGARGRQRALEEFSIQRTVGAVLGVYQQVLGGRPPHPPSGVPAHR